MNHFAKDDLLNEIRGFMWALADSLERVYAPNIGWAMLGIDREKFPAMKSGDAYAYPFGVMNLELKDIDPSKFLVTDVLLEMYDYGVEGLRRDITHNWIDFATDTEAFILGLLNFPLLNESGIQYSLRLTSHVLRLATARWKLDDEEGMSAIDLDVPEPMYSGVLTLNEVALLASMDEKSVRNATNPKLKIHLKTFNRGTRTYVNAQDAREWLSGRRGFKPTVNIDSDAERDLEKVGFFSASDFGSYIRKQREKKNLEIADVAEKLALPDWPQERLAALEEGSFVMDRTMYGAFAQILGIEKKALLVAGLALHQRLERAALEYYLDDNTTD